MFEVKMKVLITGAAGFIGSHLSELLIEKGHHVVGLDNFDPFYERQIKEENVSSLVKSEKFDFHEGDLLDQNFMKELFDKHNDIDVAVHLAAKAGVRPSLENPLGYVDANIKATVGLLEILKDQCAKIVFASSSSVYGKSKEIPFQEEQKLEDSISVYATTKHSCELFNKMYHNLYNLSVINLRFFTVYGERQRPDLAIHKFLKANFKGEPITLFGDGTMARDYTYVKDTVEGIYNSIKRISESTKPLYETYNLGNSSPVSLTSLIENIEEVTGNKMKIEHKPTPKGDVPITYADISHSEKELGYNPKTKISEGLKLFYRWVSDYYKD